MPREHIAQNFMPLYVKASRETCRWTWWGV